MMLFVCSPNFFILDEPTNHLDMETIEALGRALQKFQVYHHHHRLLHQVKAYKITKQMKYKMQMEQTKS